jgi:xylose isomerase
MDYAKAWEWELEALRTIAEYAGDLRVSIEYKPCEPRRISLLGNIGTTLLAIEQSGARLGVTLDFSHMLMAGEQPALSAALCARQDRLYGIHLNDGYGQLDDGLMVGSIHLPQTLELLRILLEVQYRGVIYFDTFPQREDPVLECAANIARVEQLVTVLRRVDRAHLAMLLQRQDGFGANGLVWEALFAL